MPGSAWVGDSFLPLCKTAWSLKIRAKEGVCPALPSGAVDDESDEWIEPKSRITVTKKNERGEAADIMIYLWRGASGLVRGWLPGIYFWCKSW